MTDTMASGALEQGLHAGISMDRYQRIDALGSSRLGRLALSPLHYIHGLETEPEDTESTVLGTAVHVAVLEPELFDHYYAAEPDLNLVAPDAAKPRATKAYREAVCELEASGKVVLRAETMDRVRAMTAAIQEHPHAKALLKQGPKRELTMLWHRDRRLCRGRIDMLGDRVAGDLKTTRDLRRFSPWEIVKHSYHLQAAWYATGLDTLGLQIEHWCWLAVESCAPFDVGVFVLDDATLHVCQAKCEALVEQLEECEETGHWPGMFPDVVQATLPDGLLAEFAEVE
jgi:exodeoxyribonuclease VIII